MMAVHPKLLPPLLVIFVVLTSFPSCSVRASISLPGFELQNVTLTYLQRAVEALQKAINFFEIQYANVNLDAVIGTRIVEGTLKILLANLERRHQLSHLPDSILNNIRGLYVSAKRVSDEAEPYVAMSEPQYYQRIGPTIHEGFWELNYSRRALSSSVPTWEYFPAEVMTETESDDCLTELYGTTGNTKETCLITSNCWHLMTSLGYSQYSLSHEIFYLQIGELASCLPQIMWHIWVNEQPELHVLQDTFCANMLREAVMIARNGYPASHQDLFMEQAALCGMYGYWQFFRSDWLDRILSWQDTVYGCFKWAGWPRDKLRIQQHRITKREERRLPNGCLCHRTTVAASALVQYVRYLTENYLATSN